MATPDTPVVIPNVIRAYNLDSGAPCTITNDTGAPFPQYLEMVDPKHTARFVTLADTTFILNRYATVQAGAATNPLRPYAALVVVRAGNYGKDYSIIIDGTLRAQYVTPDGSSAAHTANIDTSFIATELFNDLNAGSVSTTAITLSNVTHLNRIETFTEGGGDPRQRDVYYGATFTFPAGTDSALNTVVTVDGVPAQITNINGNVFQVLYTSKLVADGPRTVAGVVTNTASATARFSVTRSGNLLYITSAAPFVLTTTDGAGGAGMEVFQDKIQSFDRLPARAIDGFTIEVEGSPDSKTDNYFVEYSGTPTAGVWREVGAPGSPKGINPATMPYRLVNTGLNAFSLRRFELVDRRAGTAESNPNPGFVGSQIRDILLYRNRMVMVHPRGVSMSEDGEFGNFYRTTVSTLLDGDPIDVEVSGNRFSPLWFGKASLDTLALFSGRTQYTVDRTPILSPKTIAIQVATEIDADEHIAPVALGSALYFINPRGSFNAIRELYLTGEGGGKDTTDITAHVQAYINRTDKILEEGVSRGKLTAVNGSDSLFVTGLGPGHQNVLWHYSAYWSGQEKLQSAWGRWTFSGLVTYHESLGTDLFFLIWYPGDGLYLERMPLNIDEKPATDPYPVHLDRKIRMTGNTYDPILNRTPLDPFVTLLDSNPSPTFTTVPNRDGLYGDVSTWAQPWVAVTNTEAASVIPGVRPGEILQIHDKTGPAPYLIGNYEDVSLIVGTEYESVYEFSPLYVRKETGSGPKADPTGRLQIQRVSINHGDSGFYKAVVYSVGRDPVEYVFPGTILGGTSATIGQLDIEEGRFTFPVHSRNTQCRIVITSRNPAPFGLLSADWRGNLVQPHQSR
jgi:hypothetical protein